MSLWVPPAVAAREIDRRRQFADAVVGQATVLQDVKYWNRQLKAIDPYVQIIRANEDATHPSLRPGYYHILRDAPDGMPSVIVHEDERTGNALPLDSSILDTLRKADMWSSVNQKERRRRIDEAEAARKRERQREEDDRRQELYERLRQKTSITASIPRSI